MPTPASSVPNAGEPMTAVDHAWLRMDEPTNLMTITGVLFFAEPLSLDELRSIVAERLLPVKRFRQRVERGRGRARWVDDEAFDIDAMVERVALPAPGDNQALQARVGELMGRPLDPGRPLWNFQLVESFEGGSALITRLHHCIGDGIALMLVLLSLTELEPGGIDDNPLGRIFRGRGAVDEEALAHAAELLPEGMKLMVRPSSGELPRSRASLFAKVSRDLARLTFRGSDAATVFKGPLSIEKRATWTEAIPVETIRALKEALGASINDVVLAAVAGALRRYLEHRGQPVEALELRAVVPVSLRRVDRLADLGNRFGLVFLTLPVGLVAVRDRLAVLRARMLGLKGTLEAGVVLGLLHVFGGGPLALQRLALKIFGMKATAVMTNVPGPKRRLYLGGKAIRDILFWVPQSGHLGMGISILSYAGSLRVGITTDAGLVPDPHVLVDAFHAELAAMQREAGIEGATG